MENREILELIEPLVFESVGLDSPASATVDYVLRAAQDKGCKNEVVKFLCLKGMESYISERRPVWDLQTRRLETGIE